MKKNIPNIKIKVIQTPKGRLLIVDGFPPNDREDALPNGNWKILGKLPDITEEQAKEVVEEYPATSIVRGPLYLCFTGSGNIWDLHTAKESIISLVELRVPLKNKLGEYPTEESTGLKYGMEYLSKVAKWEEEQEKVFTDPVLFWENKNEQQ